MLLSAELLASLVLALAASAFSITRAAGIESAALYGLVLPLLFAAAAARRASSEHGRGVFDRSRAVMRALVLPTMGFILVLAVNVGWQLLEPACLAWDGVPWLIFGPWPGMVLASLVGVAAGSITPKPARAVALALLIVAAPLVVLVWEVYATPAVFVYTLFAGHWPGPIYDEATAFPAAFVTYRAITLLAIMSLALTLRGGPRVGRAGVRVAHAVVATSAGVAFLVLTLMGADLGHRTNVERIDAALGARVRGERCVLHVPSEMPSRERRRVLAECEAHVRGVERALHVHRRTQVHAFFYRSADEKGALIGASETYVAKPWRDEVHVQREAFPHGVLRHEIAHVVAAEIGPWPFRSAGRLGGLLTNPQLVEGLAVALAPEAREGLSTDQWSRAMLDLGHLPRAEALSGAGFLGQGAAASYAASGSFIAHVLRERGADRMHAIYRSGRVGSPAELRELERSWHRHLRGVALPPEALELARVRLLDHGLFATRCARLRARLADRMGAENARRDFGAALGRCRSLLAIDSGDAGARTTEVVLLARLGRMAHAEVELARLERDGSIPAPLLARAHGVLADRLATSPGASTEDLARAATHYAAAMAVPASDDTMRALEVRAAALSRSDAERGAILAAAAEAASQPTEARVLYLLDASRRLAHDGLVAYLLARRLANDGNPELAAPLFVEARARGLSTSRLEREALRMLARTETASYLEGSADASARDRAEAAYALLRREPDVAEEAAQMTELLSRGVPARD